MKKILLLSLVLLALTQATCKKEKKEAQLPPETQTGAYTFGCKVNGKVFVPQDGRGKPGLYAQYVNLGEGWFLNIPAVNQQSQERETVRIKSDSLLLLEGNTYPLKKGKGSAEAEYDFGSDFYAIQSSDIGTLIITKHDQELRILSGRFSFTATNQSGNKVEITDGRFDIVY